jgi:hypothetical protein
MLSGMKRDQTEVAFSGRDLQPADGILIGSDLQFMAVVTILDLGSNSIRSRSDLVTGVVYYFSCRIRPPPYRTC